MNRHVVDRMGDIKQQIDVLQEEYAGLRQQVLAGEVEREGDEYAATFASWERRSTDYELAQELLAEDVFDRIVSRGKVTAIFIKAKRPV